MHRLNFDFAQEQVLEINYYFDKMLAEYPYNHEVFTGEVAPAKSKLTERLSKNLPDLNKPDYLQKSDFTDYARAYFSYLIYVELKGARYRDADNRNLKAIWRLLPLYVTDRTCLEFWQYDYLSYHIDNLGIKNIDEIAAVPGVDMLFLGQNDLCMSMGLFEKYEFPLMYTSPELQAATDKLRAAAKKNNVILGLFLFGTSRVGEFLEKGFPFISVGNDLHHILTQAGAYVKDVEAVSKEKGKAWTRRPSALL